MRNVNGEFGMRGFVAGLVALAVCSTAMGLEGDIRSHDPSTVVVCVGKYYVFSTGNGAPILMSDDGFTFRRAGSAFDRIPDEVRKLSPKNNGTQVWAPDIVHANGQYFLYYAVSSWGDYASVVGLMTSPTLDQNSPEYKWTDKGPIVWSDGVQNLNAIDPGVFVDPTDKSMWLCYGSYKGNIELVQLDPTTGLRLNRDLPATIIANTSEAADIMYHEGWYYLLTNHGSCCQGATSTYNIRVGRSKKVTGPYVDSFGVDMAKGGGNLFAAAGDRKIGPGHFGLLDMGDGVQKFSCHYEADLDHPGPSVLDIRPLLWNADGWPLAGSNLKDGTYQIRSKRTGTVVEIAIPGVPAIQAFGRGSGGGRGRGATAASGPASAPGRGAVATTEAATQPVKQEDVRMAGYLLQTQQKWSVSAVPTAGGVAGQVYVRITGAGGRVLEATADGVVAGAALDGKDGQLWLADELADGTWRLKPKGSKMVLSAEGRSNVVLKEWDAADERERWELAAP
jgi:arabinan endo-1,5-alpha-L-arabinosidase